MITIEATDKKTRQRIGQLCLTDPHDGGSRERNASKTEEWKASLAAEHPEAEITYAACFD